MSTSGTYTFATTAASGLTLVAYGRIGIRRTEITAQHLADAANEANLLQVTISNNQPNLWRSEVYDITLTQGTASYDLPARMVAVQDIYMTTTPTGGSASTSTDRLLFPMTLFEWDAQPNKTAQAAPTTYTIFKTIPTPTIKFWQVPDDSATYTAHVRMLSQVQDASQVSGAITKPSTRSRDSGAPSNEGSQASPRLTRVTRATSTISSATMFSNN